MESGNRAATPAFAAACARALGVEIGELTRTREPREPRGGQLPSELARVQTQLDLYDLDPDETIQPRTLRELRMAVREINKIAQAANYERMVSKLPSVLAELHTAAHSWRGRQQTDAWGLLAEAYRCGHTVGIAVGFPELSLTALSRMD